MKKIGIVGSTGMLGVPVTNAFIDAGFKVTVLVRNIEKAKRLFQNKVKYCNGDLKDKTSLSVFLAGQEYLYLNLSVAQKSTINDFQPEREGLDNIIKVANEFPIKRIGYLSSLIHFYEGQNGFHWWAFKLKKEAVQKIKSSGIPYTIFYPSTFMENFDKGAYRKGNFITLAGTSRFKMFLVAADDYGKQVVNAFEIDKGSREFVIQGEEGFTADEAATYYKNHCNHVKIMVVTIPLRFLKLAGKFNKRLGYGARMIEALNNYPEKFEAEETWDLLGKPRTKFLDYINTD